MTELTHRVIRAFEFAWNLHTGSVRKGTSIPYIVHPWDVALILMKNKVPESVVVAALLHDLIEDEGVDLAEIRSLFGEEVALYVEKASEPPHLRKQTKNKRDSWRERKVHTIEKARTADKLLKMLLCADKLSNALDMLSDYNQIQDSIWDRFNAPKDQITWYYRSLVEALGTNTSSGETIRDTKVYSQLKDVVAKLFP